MTTTKTNNQQKLIQDETTNSHFQQQLNNAIDKIDDDPILHIFGRIGQIRNKIDELDNYVRHGRSQLVDTAFLSKKIQPIKDDIEELKNQNSLIYSIADKLDTTPDEIISIKQQVFNNLQIFNQIHHRQNHLQKQIDTIVDILKHNNLNLQPPQK